VGQSHGLSGGRRHCVGRRHRRRRGRKNQASRPERTRDAGAGWAAVRRRSDAASRHRGEPVSPGCLGQRSWRPRGSLPRGASAGKRELRRVMRSERKAHPRRSYHVRKNIYIDIWIEWFSCCLSPPFSLTRSAFGGGVAATKRGFCREGTRAARYVKRNSLPRAQGCIGVTQRARAFRTCGLSSGPECG